MTWEEKYNKLKKEFEDFSYIVSHDLRAPLRAISNLSDWIQDDLGNDGSREVKSNLALLKERVTKLDSMMVSLLEYSRVERMNLEVDNVDTRKMVEESLRQINGKAAHVKIEIAADMPVFNTYKDKILIVFKYLLKNAVDHNPNPEPVVRINWEEEDAFYKFTVEDNGSGIPADKRELAFTMFRSLQPLDHSKNTGTGLTIAKKTVHFAGGDISIDDAREGGTKISFTWPKTVPS